MIYPTFITNHNGVDYLTDAVSNDFYAGKLYMFDEINSSFTQHFIAEINEAKRKNMKELTILINSPGGEICSGFAIFDALNDAIKSGTEVNMVATGLCASMAAFLLATVNPGKRYATENATIMLHQPLTGFSEFAQASDIQIKSEYINAEKNKLTKMLANATGNTYKAIEKIIDRDTYFNSKEAYEFGIIDKIIK